MDVPEKLLREKELLLKKKEAAQARCNIPEVEYFSAQIEQIDRIIQSVLKNR